MQPANTLVRTEIRVTGALAAIFSLRMFGLFLLLPVFSVLGEELDGASPALIGTAIGIYGMMQALLQIPFGRLSDRIGRKPVIVGGLLLFVAGGVVAAGAETILGVIAGRALQGAGAIASVIMALVGDVVSDAHRTRAMAAVGMSVGLSFVLALVAGPLLADALGLSGLFWMTVFMGLAAVVVAVRAIPRDAARHRAMLAPTGFGRLWRAPDLWRLNLGIFLLHLALTATFVALPRVLQDEAGLELGRHSLLYVGVMLAGVVGMVPMIIRAERHAARPVKLGAILLLALAEFGLAAAGASLWSHVAALVLFFTAFNLLEALLPSLVSRAAPAGSRGAAMGLYSSSQFVGVFLGAQIGGLLVQWVDTSAVFLVNGVLLALWLIPALGFRELPRMESRVLTFDGGAGDADARLAGLLRLDGVEDGLVIPEDRMLVVRFDPARVDRDALESALRDGARPRQT